MRATKRRSSVPHGIRIAVPAALAAAVLALSGCEPDLKEAIDDLRGAAPNACKDYCEDRLVCEWPIASGAAENAAFSSAVRRCTVDCAFTMGEGAYVAQNGLAGLEYVDHVSGGAIEDALACAIEHGTFRCADGSPTDVHAFGGVVQSMCEDADACLEELGIDQHVAWTPTMEGGGTCAASGTQWIDAEFFLP